MTTHLLLFSISLTLSINSFAQNRYLSGYVVMNNGDTLRGTIMDRNTNQGRLYRKIRFKSADSKRKKYDAYDLQGYSVEGVQFESKWFSEEGIPFNMRYMSKYGLGNKVFLRVQVKGEVTCYTKEFVDGDDIAIGGFELFQKKGEDMLQRANQGILGLKKKKLAAYFSDCPKLVDKITAGEIKRAVEVARYYNENCTQH